MRGLRAALFFVMFMAAPVVIFAYEFEDPFIPMLPKEKPKPIESIVQAAKRPIIPETINPPSVIIQGVLWGTDKPMTIIDGRIYQVGETIRGTDAKIHKIDNNQVIVVVKTQMFTLKTKNKLNKEAQ